MVKEVNSKIKECQIYLLFKYIIYCGGRPAAICATDVKWVLASSDRNGLRP